MVNELPGRDLHRFCWLEDDEIGELPLAWNWVAGVDSAADRPGLGWGSPKLLHYSLGSPFMVGYENGPWAGSWHRERSIMESYEWSSGGNG